MKKENCPFCGHRWVRKSLESTIECPNCKTEYFIQPKHEEIYDEEIRDEGETNPDEYEDGDL